MNANWNENHASLELRAHYMKWRDYLRLTMEGNDIERDAEISAWSRLVSGQGILFDYVLFVTGCGYGSAGVRAGDEICILLGRYAPFVLRPQERGNFTLLGRVYVEC